MPDPSPLGRSIGLSGVIRFVIGAAILGYKAWRARQPS